MNYRVCIPTAGIGSRLGSIKKGLNKSLINVGGKPVLSHIIEKFDFKTEFIIPIGYGGKEVKEYVDLAHPQHNIIFIEIDRYEGDGSGLGYTLSKAKSFLQCPFYFVSCDTLVKESIPKNNFNWIGYANTENIENYRTINISDDKVIQINEKNISGASKYAYIGLAFIKDYQIFWENFIVNEKSLIEGEVSGLNKLINSNLNAIKFEWNDTGNPTELEKSRNFIQNKESINILDKEDEEIWFVDDKVIKYSKNRKFIKDRVARAKNLKHFVPKIIDSKDNMYSYRLVKGKTISKVLNKKIFYKLLNFSKLFWEVENKNNLEKNKFKKICFNFYKEKTYLRIEKLFKKYPNLEKIQSINNEKVDPIYGIINKLDWDYICDGKIGQFHGDFHFENILFNDEENKFILLDWRQDFGGELKFGDIYYDLAKLMHGLIIDHEIIKENKYYTYLEKNKLFFNFERKFIHLECEKEFLEWMELNGYDCKKVYLLTALIYLNIACLHHHPYDHLLYGLGYYMLWNSSKNK